MGIINSPAHRQYVRRLMIAMTAYLVTLMLAIQLVGDRDMDGPAAWVLAALPGLCITSIFWAIGKYLVEEKDEYLRVLLIRQSLIATGFALSLATIWGFLENFGMVEHIPAFYIAILWFVGLAIGSLVNRLTIGRTGNNG